MKATEISSDRLIYQPLDTSFISQRYVDWMNDEEVNRYLESGGDYTIDQLSGFLNSVESRSILFWAIVTKSQKKHIGNIKIDPINWHNKVGEYGIMIGDKAEWKRGYANEASQRIIDFCFSKEVGLRKIMLGVAKENVKAMALYERLGFVIEGEYRAHAFFNNKWCDTYRMAKFNPIIDEL